MKVFKRNAVIITVLLFVAVAVYLNWSYNRGQDLAVENPLEEQSQAGKDESGAKETADPDAKSAKADEAAGESGTDEDASRLYYGDDTASGISESAASYFASARLTREQARDSATALLQNAAAVETASQEEIDSALGAITAMAGYSIQEAQLENLLLAKDFEQCVVFISEEGVSVIVNAPEEGLSESAVARITEAVTSELGISPEQLKIVEVN